MPLENDADQVLDPAHADNDDGLRVAGAPAKETLPPDIKFDVSEDGNIVKHGDKTYITKAALDQERQARQTIQRSLEAIEPLMPEFEEFLQNKQAGRRATVDRAARPAEGAGADDDYTNDDLEGFAIARGYYKSDNTPDTGRAKSELDIMARVADRRAAKAVGPTAQAALRDRALANTAGARNYRFSDGEPIADQKYIDAAFGALPEDSRADPAIANVTMLVAAGLEYLEGRKSGTVRRGGRREPNFREGGSRHLDESGATFDALDAAAARARGKTPEQWAKLQKQVGGGGMGVGTVLEDIN